MSHRALGEQFRGHPMVDPETWPVWQALQPDALPPGVKSWQESPAAVATVAYGRKDMLPEVTYLMERGYRSAHGHDRNNDFNEEWGRGTRNFRTTSENPLAVQ